MGGWELDAILSRQQQERELGGAVLSVLPLAPAMAQAAWEGWARRLGAVVAPPSCTADDAFAAAWRSLPRARLLDGSRAALAAALGCAPHAVDAAVAARSAAERTAWFDDLGAARPELRLAGWAIARAVDRGDERACRVAPPMTPEEAVRAAARLAGPFAILLAPAAPRPEQQVSVDALALAARAAAAVCASLPRQPVALAATRASIDSLLVSGPESASIALVRQGLLSGAGLGSDAPPRARATSESPPGLPRTPDAGGARDGRSQPERVLHAALERDRRTRGRFVPNGRLAVAFGGGPVEVDLLAEEERLAVEIDGWFHFRGPDDYRRDRRKDELLQRAGLLVLRFLADDVTGRTELVVEAIAEAIGRRDGEPTQTAHPESPEHERDRRQP
jgi:very-short-patch-repair endonuclease